MRQATLRAAETAAPALSWQSPGRPGAGHPAPSPASPFRALLYPCCSRCVVVSPVVAVTAVQPCVHLLLQKRPASSSSGPSSPSHSSHVLARLPRGLHAGCLRKVMAVAGHVCGLLVSLLYEPVCLGPSAPLRVD